MAQGTFGNPEIVQEEVDILLIGGGMACSGAAYEIVRWAEAAKAEKAAAAKKAKAEKAAAAKAAKAEKAAAAKKAKEEKAAAAKK